MKCCNLKVVLYCDIFNLFQCAFYETQEALHQEELKLLEVGKGVHKFALQFEKKYQTVCKSFRLIAYEAILKYSIALESLIELKHNNPWRYLENFDMDECKVECSGYFSKTQMLQLFTPEIYEKKMRWELDVQRASNGEGTVRVLASRMRNEQQRLNPKKDVTALEVVEQPTVYGKIVSDFLNKWLELGANVEAEMEKEKAPLTMDDLKVRSLIIDGHNMSYQ